MGCQVLYAVFSLFFSILFKTDFNIGVLYLSATVGRTFKKILTIATGSAIVKARAFGRVSIATNPMGYESL